MLPIIPIIAAVASASILVKRGMARRKRKGKINDKDVVERLKDYIQVDGDGRFDPNTAVDGTPLLFKVLPEVEVEVINKLLAYGANPNVCNADGIPLLIYAMQMNRRYSIVWTLLEHGANPNVMDSDGVPAIVYASKNGVRIIDSLLEHGADPNAKDAEGRSAIFYSDDIYSLLNAGADVNTVDIYGKTALFYPHSIYTRKKLVVGGANINVKDNDGKMLFDYLTDVKDTPFLYFLNQRGYIKIDELCRIYPGYEEHKKRINMSNKLYRAIRGNNLVDAREALENGAMPDVSYDNDNESMLNTAIRYKRLDMIKLLVEYGADVNKADVWPSPLRMAIVCKSNACFELLIQLGANPDNIDYAIKSSGTFRMKKIYAEYKKRN